MAIYHLSVKTISRSAGRSATAAAAYRAGVEIADVRTGEVHDYTRKRGVESAELVLPAGAPAWAADRAALWNAAEQAETRKNATVAREFEIALPAELSADARRRLALDFARELVARHGCAADVAIHAPGQDGDERNHHAHILVSTRRLSAEGFGEKTRELDDRQTGPQIVAQWRERFADLQNAALDRAGLEARVDHRSLAAQGSEREPTRHLGPAATAIERRGEASELGDVNREIAARLYAARELGRIERELAGLDRQILDLSGDLAAALRERDAQRTAARASGLHGAFAEALLNAGVEPPVSPVEAFSRHPEQMPGESLEQAAERVRARYVAEEKAAAVEARARAHEARAAEIAARYRVLAQQDPGKKPLLLGREAWERQHREWMDAKQEASWAHQNALEAAQTLRAQGLGPNEEREAAARALARFGQDHPALKAALEQAARERERPQDPNIHLGQYSGRVVRVDEHYVYQDHGKEVVRHERRHFGVVPSPGQEIQVRYRNGQAEVERLRSRARERGGPGFGR